ncbi:NAD-dependent protein deacetylase sirtuin-3, mitochondrial [Mizuhopecten yessoensis]|uniref:NAD-dependent protein deacetylase sirtuin-3, mitochondrial n=3 Tax=Mizuhopecten yessoensis TaxID=6573 RepID=A0A210QUH7_MIZYE|nr:NAD-dependent protein deacetylase sirtuin-3, mitochondrial [Mizuhopecten yessoensis]
MAAVGKVKVPHSLERPPSASTATGGHRTQIRAFQSNSSPVYKTQSDSNISDRMKGLSLKDRVNNKSPQKAGRSFMSTLGGAGNVHVKALNDVANLLKNDACKNVVVVAGAGISTPSGIPDFRTPGTGLYDNLKQYRIPYPEAIFDIDYFHHNPKPFFTLAKELYPSGKYRPNYIHYFVRLLHDKGMLLRMYTQNIDGLERLAGLPADKLVEAHGTFASATCTICGYLHEGSMVKDPVFQDRLPLCKRRGCPGIVKPDIVFFGEDLPQRFYFYLKDMLQADLVIIMGTSLGVQPFAGIVDTVRWTTPRVLFNMEAVGPFRNSKRSKDVFAEGDLIKNMQNFTEMVGWKTDIEDLIIKSEGVLKICDQEYLKNTAKRMMEFRRKKPPAPVRNTFFRARAMDSDSSSETESDDSSDSSSDDDLPRRRRNKNMAWNRTRKPTDYGKNGISNSIHSNGARRNGVPVDLRTKINNNNNNEGSRNYSTASAPNSTRIDKNVANGVTNSKVPAIMMRKKAGTPTGTSSNPGIKLESETGSVPNSTAGVSKKMQARIRRNTTNKLFGTKTPTGTSSGSKTPTNSGSKTPVHSNNNKDKRLRPLTGRGKFSPKPGAENNNKLTSENTKSVKQENSDVEAKENKAIVNDGKPPRPKKPPVTKELNSLNAKPYGFATPRKLPARPTVASNVIGGPKPQPPNFYQDILLGKTDTPKISYRHRLQPSNTYDARIFSYRGVISSSSEAESDSDSSDSR